ncbi:amino acid adenylation domain-containing protein, partial [Streptomyces sp. NPDC057199]|uniref:non-ribosomal peptide synthetase n=1 Tax=Streptomyces sp. NPDC057199 TaxID=3346047 RepID=UPI00363909B4
ADRERLPEGLADAYPLSQAQLGMVVEMQRGDDRNTYHNVFSMRIRDEIPFDADALRRAVSEIVARHEVLRTSVDLTTYSVPAQLVHATAEIPFTVRDLSGLDRAGIDRAVREFIAEERADVFDLERAPLLRIAAHTGETGAWRLAVTECHVVMEGWSTFTLVMEVLDAYRQIRDTGVPEPHEAPAVRYADFIAAELASLASDDDRAFWRGIVTDHPRLTLPQAWADAPGTERRQSYGQVAFGDLEPALRGLAADARASLKSVLHAAHLKVMSQLTPDERFFSGLVCNARPEARGADRVYGMHLNTLPFAYDRTAGTWRELVGQVFAREAELWSHRAFPMPEIQRELGDGRRLIDIPFTYQDFHQVDEKLIDTGATVGAGALEFGLRVSVLSGHINLSANNLVIGQVALDRLASVYRQVLEAMAGDADGDARVSFLPVGERERQLVEWNDTVFEAERVSVLERFEEQAARTPLAIAVAGEDSSLSYGELDARANQLAHHLRGLGVVAESRVLVRLDRGPDLVTALLAVWKAGGAYVPVDPSYPAERVAAMREVSGAVVTLTEVPAEALIRLPVSAPVRTDGLERLAYVIFTSGSTGVPKGVEVHHRGLANHVAWAARELASQGEGGAPLFSSVAFDLVVPNLWAPLVTGRTVHTVRGDVGLGDLGERLVASGPYSFVKLTPGHLDILAQQLTPEQASALAPVLVVAGEAFTRGTLERWRALAPDTRLINEYGPTEASVGTTIHPVAAGTDAGADADADVLPIGRPLPNMSTYVLDAALQPVPVGVAGELYVGGTGVARGYAGRPDLTAERFLPDPYGSTSGARLYRTGDLVRQLPDGTIEFLGRLDDQVKIRGFRVELGEIQAALSDHPDVRDAYVTALDGPTGDKEIAAYLAPRTADSDAVRAHLAARLPEYMIPATLTALDALPLNANGKVDRKALPTPDRDSGAAERVFTSPATDTERALAGIWSELLGIERIAADDNFFDLGGHSMLIIKVMAAARKQRLPISLRMLYETKTLAELAAEVDAQAAKTRPAPAARTARGPEPAAPALLPGMAEHRVPGAVVARIQDGEVAGVQAYGVLAAGATETVTPQTLFQAGSISKLVTALGVLRLVDQGRLDLDEDVNAYLTSWQVTGPSGAPARVTPRHLLSHRSGLTVVGNAGYRPGEPMPTVLDLLTGRPPLDTPSVHAEQPPGGPFKLANTNYSVIQQLLEDLTGTPFAPLLRELVLEPLRMAASGFEQDFPGTSGRPAARGHDSEGRTVDGGWRVRPQLASSGLWSTAGDLAKVAVELRRAYRGEPYAVLSRPLAEQMFTTGDDGFYGLGAVVDGIAPDLEVGHGGEPYGYRNMLMVATGSGSGFVALTNAESGREVLKPVAAALREQDDTFGAGRAASAWSA